MWLIAFTVACCNRLFEALNAKQAKSMHLYLELETSVTIINVVDSCILCVCVHACVLESKLTSRGRECFNSHHL